MANDVKALPVVAWHDPTNQGLPFIPHEFKQHAPPGLFGRYASALVRQSDAESALAELRAEVERLRADARRYEYVLNCEVMAASRYIKVDPEAFKANRRAAHDAQIIAYLVDGND